MQTHKRQNFAGIKWGSERLVKGAADNGQKSLFSCSEHKEEERGYDDEKDKENNSCKK